MNFVCSSQREIFFLIKIPFFEKIESRRLPGKKHDSNEIFSWVLSLILKECIYGTQNDTKGDPTGYKI